ncbi:mannitol dehydrogenase family protein [Pontixanthobacter aquaemixtae]|uniref:Mannitol dehydrogenase family protein n=1 Tax=Pontixanthobacter aquaemixtae TaxID=1958940 RepID=A0A844ZTD4_9SPHN|nr:mannitol dehydrogenase family protein [Pontixanthobacter aquaemixtae]MXO90380.1 mannitol dehydrogenase family protein [Pontixanthobacter aquaemixtae]
MRLGPDSIHRLSEAVERFSYDRDAQKIGIVHFGIGAFHRAHMAWYTDLAMNAGDRDWAICGVSMRSPAVTEQLGPQGGLYTLTERAVESAKTRIIGSVREVLYAPEQFEQVVARLADPACSIASLTVTEKGYARGEGVNLDIELARHSFYPILSEALRRRQVSGFGGLTILSCDNLADNGRVLDRLLRQWIDAEQPELRQWYESECRVPSTMVDRIVPRTRPEDLGALNDRIGLVDKGAVFTEEFSQWVIEDDFAGPRPRWEEHGVELVQDVAPFETAKLRMLNGAHSMLAYCGLRAGFQFVHEAVADPALRDLADKLMREEAMPTIEATQDQDLDEYANHLMKRFADPALMHRLDQIAMDGTQKIPQRWLDTAKQLVQIGRPLDAIRTGFDAWLWHLADGRWVDDPHGGDLMRITSDEGHKATIEHCLLGGKNGDPLWPGYAELAGVLA